MKFSGLLSKRIITFLLVFSMVSGIVPVFGLTVFADDDEEEEVRIQDWTSLVFENIDAFLASMGRGPDGEPTGEPTLTRYGFELFYQYEMGAVAVRDTRTGQVLTTNPWDIGNDDLHREVTGTAPTVNIKEELLSQIMIEYMDANTTVPFLSYRQAALNNQIRMRPIRGGIRVEYTMGRVESRIMVPRLIPADSFRYNILAHFPEGRPRQQMLAYYSLKDADDPTLTARAQRELQVRFPVTSRFPVYVFDPHASRRELNQIEGYIRRYTEYTFEMMDEDHRQTEFQGLDRPPPLFKMALEYYLEPDGLRVRMPANGIRFDEGNYRLVDIRILPFMGVTRRENIGYTFVPDGSGALVRNEDIRNEPFTLQNRLYGPDFSFFRVTQGAWTQNWRMPVFGAVEEHVVERRWEEEEEYYVYVDVVVAEAVMQTVTDEEGNETEVEVTPAVIESVREDRIRMVPVYDRQYRRDGFLAIIEEGDALASITTNHGGALHRYNNVFARFTPRPTDEFRLDAAATGLTSMITTSSRRRFTGNFMIRYIMLSENTPSPHDPRGGYAGGSADRIIGSYEASWVGMATAYRNYLERNGGLVRKVDTGGDIPLFIETLGQMGTSEHFLGFPYWRQTPLTSFDDVQSMISDFNDEGISNLNFRLRGWNNNGMMSFVPTTIRVHRNMGGANAVRDLMAFAESRGANIFPDVEIGLIWGIGGPFNGFNHRRDLARSMNDMFSMEQHYWFLAQDVTRFGMGRMRHNITAPRSLRRVYELAMRDFNRLNPHAISVASLSRDLHSDQNRRNLVNRAEAQDYVREVLAMAQQEHTRVIGEQANAFAWRYLDAALNVPLHGSRFMNQSEEVPFYGMVTHGFIDTAGRPINTSGDERFDILKAIENGASPYFIVAYQNANRLMENMFLASNFSVNYHTWFPDIVRIYNILNEALAPVRYSLMVNHEFLANNVVRVTYENGISFILNYNNAVVEVEGHTIEPLSFIKIN